MTPAFEITGTPPPTDGVFTVVGVVASVVRGDQALAIDIADPAGSDIALTIARSGITHLDLVEGSSVMVDHWYRQGFEGVAQGLRIRDDAGLVLIVEDGDYGNAITGPDLAPFTISQTDLGCRNRDNRPGDLNNFGLIITVDDTTVEVLPGEQASVAVEGRDYSVVSLRSTSRHSGVEWTDAPYTHTSFSISRSPAG